CVILADGSFEHRFTLGGIAGELSQLRCARRIARVRCCTQSRFDRSKVETSLATASFCAWIELRFGLEQSSDARRPFRRKLLFDLRKLRLPIRLARRENGIAPVLNAHERDVRLTIAFLRERAQCSHSFI